MNAVRKNRLSSNNVDSMYCMHMYTYFGLCHVLLWTKTNTTHCYSQCICFDSATDFQIGNVASATTDKCLKKEKQIWGSMFVKNNQR